MEQKNIEDINRETQNKIFNPNNSLIPIEGETPEETAKRFASNYKFSNNKAIRGIEKFFQFDTLGAIMKKEVIGGLATFLSLVYILSVQPGLVSGTESITEGAPNMNYFGIFFATAIASGVGCIFMGLFANVPVAVSTTMGINTLVAFSVGNAGGLGYEGALIVTMISSILFVTLSLTPLRTKILRVIPKEIILAIGIGIGVFISYIGLQSMGWFSTTPAGPALGNLSQNWLAIILGMATLAIILILSFRNIPGAVAIGIVAMFIIALIIANLLPEDSHWLGYEVTTNVNGTNITTYKNGFLHDANFKLNGGWTYDFGGLISNWDNTFSAFTNMDIWNNPIFYVSVFIILLMNFFDATGTLATFTHQLNKNTNQHHEISSKALIVDASGTMVASLMGTTPLGTFVESSVGIQQGARTGFAAIINGLLFFLAIALFPIFKAIPQCITGAACVYIGIMLFKEAELVNWTKMEFVVPTFLTVVFMISSYEIANGIAIGFISYAFMMLIMKKGKEVSWIMYLLAILFIAYFIAFAFVQ
ncbi:xanthine/uracil permease [Spiroplasma sp. TIUS-1]|uniref:NCS2 family permease n=1 Tax=Spiroplasma sp. TIUS-1 TaxID=216963 RepID=UPI0013993484|nr:NCS2 family permease [Spiroplasma sp. TIUS-1]QHX36148.1 xanthine/uracil permease [Spiroplasma sp. TIUS-1]